MQLVKYVNEMTMLSGGINQNIINNIFKELDDSEHIGDIDGLRIMSKKFDQTICIGLEKNNIILSFITYSNSDIDDKIMTLGVAYTKPEFRNKNHIKQILWFLKNVEGLSFIDSGVNTKDGIMFFKSLAKSERFDLFWYNIQTKEKIKYDSNIDNKNNKPYRDISKKTDWRILIESDNYPLPRWWWREGNSIDPKKFNMHYIFENDK